MSSGLGRVVSAGVLALAAISMGGSALLAADTNTLPVPAITIYPGDAIRDGSLVDREFPSNFSGLKFGMISDRVLIVGKIARRTLLPGAPIPTNGVMEPKVVTNGAKVRVVFKEGGLTITTYAAAMQAGGVGDVVSVRNLESGLTISGIIQADGSVRVSGG